MATMLMAGSWPLSSAGALRLRPLLFLLPMGALRLRHHLILLLLMGALRLRPNLSEGLAGRAAAAGFCCICWGRCQLAQCELAPPLWREGAPSLFYVRSLQDALICFQLEPIFELFRLLKSSKMGSTCSLFNSFF